MSEIEKREKIDAFVIALARVHAISLHEYGEAARALVALLDKQPEPKCERCGGIGWYSEHDPACTGDCDGSRCPVQVQCNCGAPVKEASPLSQGERAKRALDALRDLEGVPLDFRLHAYVRELTDGLRAIAEGPGE